MQTGTQPIVRDLVMVGGGHSHAIALKLWGTHPIPGVRVTLLTDTSHTPYSGMLPGYVAGFYTYDECHIDLHQLANFAGAHMIRDRAVGLDLQENRVLCAEHPPIRFDVLSLDIDSTPQQSTIPGAAEYAIPIKPVTQFLQVWQQITESIQSASGFVETLPYPLRLAIVGGGVGGVELALSMDACLRRLKHPAEVHLFQRRQELVPQQNAATRRRLHRWLQHRRIRVHTSATISQITKQRRIYQLQCQSGKSWQCDRVFWVTNASAPPWIAESGLDTDREGFVLVRDTLQSVSHPQVFAAGDIATMQRYPRPKAGVFAVRQGKPLFQNLQRALLEKPLQPFTPQKKYLILIGTGQGKAIASRGSCAWGPSPWLWHWKDRIDRQFVARFQNLAATQPPVQSSKAFPYTDSGNDGISLSSAFIQRVLVRVERDAAIWKPPTQQQRTMDPTAARSCKVFQVSSESSILETIDYLYAVVGDGFLFGKIVARHCLSQQWAMGATPQHAMAIAVVTHGNDLVTAESLYQLVNGTIQGLSPVPLFGIQASKSRRMALGLAIQGKMPGENVGVSNRLYPEQTIFVTKALGVGTLLAADCQLQAKGRWVETAIASMLLANENAALCLRQHGATACVSLGEEGLAGYLWELVRVSRVGVELILGTLPSLEGAIATLEAGIVSPRHQENQKIALHLRNADRFMGDPQTEPQYHLLFDPQISGGLLAAVPNERANACLQALYELGYTDSTMVAQVVDQSQGIRLK
ncbi:selenide, water dikinase SelD [Geitlerinema sp. PCC 9228]|uniref:selenide, water dikinase SelD n=1 Tax=Geitlerinema sp. PCC 9228 TaxID=111611 RepID=UPI0008F9C2B2|nr:selenide, water dikinase SelD [Geitlerinema sp. PCC 9228]